MILGRGCRLLLVALVCTQALALPRHHQGLIGDGVEGQDLDVFFRQTRKHARPMFYINCSYRDLCYCYSKMTRHHYCCSCDMGACFPASARAATPSGTPTPMNRLRTGDEVLAVDNQGTIISTRILGFLDRRPQETALYLTLRTAAGHNLTLSPNHVLFRATPSSSSSSVAAAPLNTRNDNNNNNASRPAISLSSTGSSSVFGAEVNIGDVIFSASGNQTNLEATDVIGFDYEVKQGAYVPLTQEGTLLVDGVYVSCYASYSHARAHQYLAPARAFPSLLRLRPGLLEKAVYSMKKAISRALLGLGNLIRRGEEGEECENEWQEEEGDDGGDDEEEGEAYIVSAVKQIGRLWYSHEQSPSYVLQVRSSLPSDSLLGNLWPRDSIPQTVLSFLGALVRSW